VFSRVGPARAASVDTLNEQTSIPAAVKSNLAVIFDIIPSANFHYPIIKLHRDCLLSSEHLCGFMVLLL
jgi:hypothetical protein